jgi:hypothetical protein
MSWERLACIAVGSAKEERSCQGPQRRDDEMQYIYARKSERAAGEQIAVVRVDCAIERESAQRPQADSALTASCFAALPHPETRRARDKNEPLHMTQRLAPPLLPARDTSCRMVFSNAPASNGSL